MKLIRSTAVILILDKKDWWNTQKVPRVRGAKMAGKTAVKKVKKVVRDGKV